MCCPTIFLSTEVCLFFFFVLCKRLFILRYLHNGTLLERQVRCWALFKLPLYLPGWAGIEDTIVRSGSEVSVCFTDSFVQGYLLQMLNFQHSTRYLWWYWPMPLMELIRRMKEDVYLILPFFPDDVVTAVPIALRFDL